MEPIKQGDKTPEQDFSDGELLYRRFPPSMDIQGEVLASSIRFDEPPSFCREKWAKPEDTIHRDCAHGQNVSHFGVFCLPVSSVRSNWDDGPGVTYRFQPLHAPEVECYAHSEVHCDRIETPKALTEFSSHIEPSRRVRKAFRAHIAPRLVVLIEPGAEV
jgi:hypothetical protein